MDENYSIEKKFEFQNYIYYIIIAILSVIMLVFLPMAGSVAGLEWVLPTTFAGWVVYVLSKICSAAFNVLIFHCFIKQAKVNIQFNETYLEAQNLLQIAHENKNIYYRSPDLYFKELYGKKGLTIFLTTIVGTVGLSQAVLTFDLLQFLVQLVTLIMGIIFGVLQMKSVESFWTGEYYGYAKTEYKKIQEVNNNVIQDK